MSSAQPENEVPSPPPHEVTRLLVAMGAGDQKAASDLLPLVYEELRRLARSRMDRESPQTLQPTALVHEAYMRLVGEADRPQWNGRGHFFGAAARAMRAPGPRARREGTRPRIERWTSHS